MSDEENLEPSGKQPPRKKKHRDKIQRKKVFINPRFQLSYTGFFLSVMLFSSAVIFGCFYLGVWDGVLDGLSHMTPTQVDGGGEYEQPWLYNKSELAVKFITKSGDLSPDQQHLFDLIFEKSNQKIIPALIFVSIVIVMASVFLSFRIAGPMYRIHADLSSVDRGNLSKRIRLRSYDDCKSIAEDINNLLDNFDTTIENFKKITRDYHNRPDEMIQDLGEQLRRFRTTADMMRESREGLE